MINFSTLLGSFALGGFIHLGFEILRDETGKANSQISGVYW